MARPTGTEREILELINRIRMDPAGETAWLVQLASSDPEVSGAVNFFNVDLGLFQQQMAAYSAVAPLAWSDALGLAADRHSQVMIDFDQQSHQLPGEPDLGTRVSDAGYDLRRVAENVFAFSESAVQSHAAFVIDWGNGPGGMQTPAGHRINIMNETYTDAGIGAVAQPNSALQVGPLVVTHNLGSSGDFQPHLVGVAFADNDSDTYYDAGEGLGGVTVTATGSAGSFSTTTWDAGGYQIALPNGAYTLTFAGGGLASTVTKSVTVNGANAKVDVLASEANATPAQNTPTTGDDILALTQGDQTLDGLDGTDTVVFSGSKSTATVTLQADGVIMVKDQSGDGGTDTLTNIEIAQFTDTVLDFRDFTSLTQLSSDQFTQLAEMYVAYFNRAADAEGLFFWADKLAEGIELNQVAELFFDQAETRALYPNPSDTDTFVTTVYDNVLGRTPDPAGFNFWAGHLASGAVTQGSFVLEIINGAKNGGSPGDVAYLAEKADLGLYFSAILGMSTVEDATQVMAVFGDQATSNTSGAVASVEQHYSDATASDQFLFHLVGVVEDPFSGVF